MTLLKLGDQSIVLEKVCAFELVRPAANLRGAEAEPYLRVLLDGGNEMIIYGRRMISNFTAAMKALAK